MLTEALAALTAARERYWLRLGSDEELGHAWDAVAGLIGPREIVLPVKSAPPCDTGAPRPVLVSTSASLFLAYDRADGERCLLTFQHVDSVLFGGSNDEALHGHRLWDHGLEYYAFQEVINSAWIIQREHENSIHPYHRADWLARYRHFIFTFHDETFECIAADFRADDLDGAPPAAVAALSI